MMPSTAQQTTKALVILSVIGLAGCATMTGPTVSRGEIKAAKQLLEVKALKAQHEQLVRINTVGYRIVQVVPAWEEGVTGKEAAPPKPLPFAGWLLDDLNAKLARAYALQATKGVLVTGVIPQSPAAQAGLQTGDVLARLNNQPVASVRAVAAQVKKLTPGQVLTVLYERQAVPQQATLTLAELPKRTVFRLVEHDSVNASAEPGGLITLTTGMMRFLRSDDELAVVVAHELAHSTRGHLMKSFGQELFASLIGGVIGGLVEAAAGGGGRATADVTAAMVRAPFAQDLEREADYVGIQYAHLAGYDIRAGAQVWERFAMEQPKSMGSFILSTHPTTPERLVALQKTVEEFLGPQAMAATPATPTAAILPPTGGAPAMTSGSAGTMTLTPAQLDALVEQRAQALAANSVISPTGPPLPPSLEDWLKPPPGGFYSSREIREIGLAADLDAYNVLLHMGTRVQGKGERFPLSQGKVEWYAKLTPKFSWKPPTFRIVWYAPDGSSFHEDFFRFSKIDANLIRSKLEWDPTREDLKGTWRVEVFEDGKVFDRRSFVVE